MSNIRHQIVEVGVYIVDDKISGKQLYYAFVNVDGVELRRDGPYRAQEAANEIADEWLRLAKPLGTSILNH